MSPARPVQLAPGLRALAIVVMATLSPALGPANALAQQPVNNPPPIDSAAMDSSHIQAIIADQVTAWDVGNAKAFSKSFADDGSFTNIRGTVFYGHRAFEERHAEIFRTFFKGSKLVMSVDQAPVCEA